jgi:hypothetical protein
MDKLDKKNALILGGLVGVASVATFGLYYYLTKTRKIHLNAWLEDYFKDLETKLVGNSTNPSVDTILNIFFLSSELEEYLYLKENQDLEEERLENVNNKEIYEHLVFETEKRKDKCTTRAIEYIEKRLNVSFARLHEILRDTDKQTIRMNIEAGRRPYSVLPSITTDKVRDAYKAYIQLVMSCDYVTKQQLAIVERNPEYEGVAMKIIHINRCLMEDTIRKSYGVRPKYLQQLLKEHKLLEEPEIRSLNDTFKSIN